MPLIICAFIPVQIHFRFMIFTGPFRGGILQAIADQVLRLVALRDPRWRPCQLCACLIQTRGTLRVRVQDKSLT